MNEISQAIAERTDVTVADLSDELLETDEPLVLRGLASGWPAAQHCTWAATIFVKTSRS